MRARLLPTLLGSSLCAPAVSACGSEAEAPAPAAPQSPGGKADGVADPLPANPPKRIILLVGDGMGVAAISAAAHASDAPLAMLSMPHTAFQTTHEHEFVTTDSAASATAMASGEKTHFEGVGVAPGTDADDEEDVHQHLATIIDSAEAAGWRTGLVSTTSIVDATPAAFAAHRAKRRSKAGIAEDLAASGVDVLISGGRKHFDDRSDGQNLLNRMREEGGYSIAKTALGLKRASGSKQRVVGLLHEADMPPVTTGERVMELPDLVDEALEILDTENDEGFFLMVEGAQIDRREHELDAEGTIAEALDFDAAVARALAYARGRDDTLVVVTADHETGGLAVLDAADADAHIAALGGEDDALALAASGGFGDFAPAFAHVALGEGAPVGEDVERRELTATFGDMSLASRPFWSGPTFAFRAAHTPVMVPLFAEGPGAEFVARTQDNAETGQRLRLLAEAAAAEPQAAVEDAVELQTPQHVVLFVSDLVGLPAFTAAHYNAGQLRTTTLDVRGLVAPQATDHVVPDAAAAASALATGAPHERGQLARRGTDAVTTILELADQRGVDTGLVTTGTLTDPATAAFFAHATVGDQAAIAEAAVRFGPDGDGLDVVFAGGAYAWSAEQLQAWSDRGATIDDRWGGSGALGAPSVRLLAPGALDPASDRLSGDSEHPTLAEMTERALDRLVVGDEGSVTVIVAAGAAAAVAEHSDGEALVAELVDLDAAVAVAAARAAERDDTAVIVTSLRDATTSILDNHYGFHKNHCGVTSRCDGPETLLELAVAIGAFPRSAGMHDEDLQGEFGTPAVFVQSSWLTFRAHAADGVTESASAHLTPLFATGAGTRALAGFHTGAQIGEALAGWLQ